MNARRSYLAARVVIATAMVLMACAAFVWRDLAPLALGMQAGFWADQIAAAASLWASRAPSGAPVPATP